MLCRAISSATPAKFCPNLQRSLSFWYNQRQSHTFSVMNWQKWTGYFQSLFHSFLKVNCPLCHRPTRREFCQDCQRQLLRCQFPQGGWLEVPAPVFVWGRYTGHLKRAIAAFKYENQPQLGKIMGQWMATAWLASPEPKPEKSLVIPIPLHRDKLKQRGYNQAELLARSFCHWTEFPCQAEGLIRLKNTQALFGLSATERQATLKNVFEVNPQLRKSFRYSSVLLVDDIYTTGNTVKEAIQALSAVKIPVSGVIALATTRL